MGRRRVAARRETPPDAVFQSRLVQKFVNSLMYDGKKSRAESVFYGAMDRIGKKVPAAPLAVFRQAVENCKPAVETRPRRVGGATYQVPMEVRPERRTTLAIRWLIEHARGRPGHSMAERLSDEVLEASNNQGGAIKKKEEVHKMAEANKAFAHYRW
jgi:small subunit ribosomal protein S7